MNTEPGHFTDDRHDTELPETRFPIAGLLGIVAILCGLVLLRVILGALA